MARKKFRFNVEYLDANEVKRRFSFSSAGALFSRDAAEIDPLRFAHRLVSQSIRHGLRVFTGVTVREVIHSRHRVILTTDSDHRVRARRVILAAGYESTEFLRRKLVRLKSTYVFTTQPVSHFDGWADRCLIWEAGRPYHYLRTTHDRRLMIGGGDEDFVNAKKRDALIGRKTQLLQRRLEELFPAIDIEPAFAWAGTFGDTKDGLPYIGSLPSSPNILFALCYGANGTNFAMIGADLARDWVRQKRSRDARLFSLDR